MKLPENAGIKIQHHQLTGQDQAIFKKCTFNKLIEGTHDLIADLGQNACSNSQSKTEIVRFEDLPQLNHQFDNQ